MSNTTHKQQGAHQHLIYVHAQEQHCISLIYYCIISVLVMFWVFFFVKKSTSYLLFTLNRYKISSKIPC